MMLKKYRQYLTLGGVLWLFLLPFSYAAEGGAEQTKAAKSSKSSAVKEASKEKKAPKEDKPHFGRYEKVSIAELGDVVVPVKLDTGAYTASLNAVNIEHFVKDHESWVRFNPVVNDEPLESVELPIVKVSKIKQRAEEEEEEEPSFAARPVVKMNVCLGGISKEIDVNLTNRNNFRYPMLIGAKALRQFRVVVDASLRNTVAPQCE